MKLTQKRLDRIKNNDPSLYKLVFRDQDFGDVSISDLTLALQNNKTVKEIILENMNIISHEAKWSFLWRKPGEKGYHTH
ncbi:MAG: hypothetical protein HY939_04820 [Gammaproteobacteria bacterium]|nr:hypothetical protein [Gammaproteobacteria bacterium]